MNECFRKIIGINGDCSGIKYQLLLDDIGISLFSASKTADSRFNTGLDLVNRKISQAWNEVFKDLTVDGFSFGKILCNKEIEGFGDINVLNNSTSTINLKKKSNRMTSISFDYFKFDVNNDEIYTLNITDGIETFTYIGNNKYIDIDSKFLGENIEISLSYISANNRSIKASSSCCNEDCNISISGNDNFGMSFSVSESCDFENYFCKYAKQIGEAVIYKAGALVLTELVNSDRINDFKVMKQEDLWTRIAYMDSSMNLYAYQNQVIQSSTSTVEVKEGRYQIELKRLNNILPKPKDRFCLSCSGSKYLVAIP